VYAHPAWASWGAHVARELEATWGRIPAHVRKEYRGHVLLRWLRRSGKDATRYPLSVLILPEVTVEGRPCSGSYDGWRDVLCVSGASLLGLPDARRRHLLAHELAHGAVLAHNKIYRGAGALWRSEQLVEEVVRRWGF
jgi:hypothetical protein